jgi:hypothetical protein
MRPAFLLALLVISLAAPAAGEGTSASAKHRGVSWVGGAEPVTMDHLRPLKALGVNWIVQTPFGWQERVDSTELQLLTGGGILWGERDEGLTTTHRLAQQLGIQTLLKPHIWLHEQGDGQWRTDIRMGSEEDWQRWFASYRTFILHYARLAEREKMGALAVGTELHRTAVEREADWRRLIAEVRAVYSGKLTYAANWWREYEEVRFWDALDFIGIQGYFPLTEREQPGLDDLRRGWQPHLARIEAVSRKFGRPVVFTELGYKSTADAAIRPWEWPEHASTPQGAPAVDLEMQARAYRAFFDVVWQRPWFLGCYFWKWYPDPTGRRRVQGIDFTPQGKPALEILRQGYGGLERGRGPAPTPTTPQR